ncbi:heparinase II/III family protein [Paenibacillus hodogayensis]|uniref:Heparinase II/III family protein n=1 Tax=Paenibacillus hodogayensis TaxID=279208 RepID=A0ABV5W4F8_9BACL
MKQGTGSEGEAGSAEVRLFPDKWAIMRYPSICRPEAGLAIGPDWEGSAELTGFVTAFHNEPAARDTLVRAALAGDRLHLMLESGPGGDILPETETETVFVLISLPEDRDMFYTVDVEITAGAHRYQIGYNNWTRTERRDQKQTFVRLAGEQDVRPLVEKRMNGSWTAEVSIPLELLGNPDRREGAEWRFNVVRYGGPEASEPMSSWVPIRTGTIRMDDIHRPLDERIFRVELFAANEGRLGSVFIGRPPAPPSAADTTEGGGAGPDGPAEAGRALAASFLPSAAASGTMPRETTLSAALLYRSFTAKALRLSGPAGGSLDAGRISLVWVDPLGRQSIIVPSGLPARDGNGALEFAHPAPLEEGLYHLRVFLRNGHEGLGEFCSFAFDRCGLIEAGESCAEQRATETAKRRQIVMKDPSERVEQLLRLIPDRIGFFAAGVPHAPVLGFRSANYTWSPDNPWSIVSVDEDRVAYPNDSYPESKSVIVRNKKGEPVDYPYYEDERGRRYFLSAHLWHWQRRYAVNETALLAAADPLGAARVLYGFAQAYAGWVRFNDSVWVQHPIDGRAHPPYPYFGGMWDRWSLMDLHGLLPLIDAFIEVDGTNAFELLGREWGGDVRGTIVDDMLRPSLESALSYPVLQHNVDYPNWIGLIQLGKALGEPRYVHEGAERLARFAQNAYLSDGFWKEVSLSYHRQTYEGIVATARRLKGWSDPEGYVSPRDGTRFASYDPEASIPRIGRMLRLPDMLSYPDGFCLPVNDTWAFQRAERPLCTGSLLLPFAGIAKLTRGRGRGQAQLYLTFCPNNGHDHKDPLNVALYAEGRELLPDIGYTHTFYRQWTLSTLGHNTVTVDSRDARLTEEARCGGNIELFAGAGAAQLIRARQENAYEGVSAYSRELWLIGFEGAEADSGYTLDLFRVAGGKRHEYTLNGDANRDCLLVPNVPMTEYGPYLLEGTPQIIEPKQETDFGGTSDQQYYAYAFVKDVRTAEQPDGIYTLTMTSRDGQDGETDNGWSGSEQDGSGPADSDGPGGASRGSGEAVLKVHGFAGAGSNRLFAGRAPSLRATRLNGLDGDRNSEAIRFDMPKWIVRRESPDGSELLSQFIHVFEPYAGGSVPAIDRVKVLHADEAAEEAVVAVTYGEVTDIILSAPRYECETLRCGPWELAGKAGFVRLVGGKVQSLMLVGGTLLRADGRELTSPGPVAGRILEVRHAAGAESGRQTLVTDASVPESAVGQYAVIVHPDGTTHAFPVVSVQMDPTSGRTELGFDEDLGFDYTGGSDDGVGRVPTIEESDASSASRESRALAGLARPSAMTAYPHAEWRGLHTFRIDGVATAAFPPE